MPPSWTGLASTPDAVGHRRALAGGGGPPAATGHVPSAWRASGHGGAGAPYSGPVTLRTLREAPARPLTALTALLLAAGLLAGCSSTDEPAADPTPSASETGGSDDSTAPADEASDSASEGTGVEFSYAGREGATALDLLLEADPSAAITGEGENAFVTAIDGVAADPASEFWALYVDGEPATVGAGSVQTKDGEEITWQLETFTS